MLHVSVTIDKTKTIFIFETLLTSLGYIFVTFAYNQIDRSQRTNIPAHPYIQLDNPIDRH